MITIVIDLYYHNHRGFLCVITIVIWSNFCKFSNPIFLFNAISNLFIRLFRIQYKTLIAEACFFFPNSTLQEIAWLHCVYAVLNISKMSYN